MKNSVNESQKKALLVATVAAVIAGFLLLNVYLMLVIFSAIVVILFNPVYKWLLSKKLSKSSAATITMLTSLLVVIIPVIIVGAISLVQIDRLVSNISTDSYSLDSESVNKVIDKANDTFEEIGVSLRVSTDGIAEAVSKGAQQFGKILLEGLFNSITGFFAFLTASIIYLYVFISMLTKQDKIIDTIKKLNPLGEDISDLYMKRISAMTKATVRGQLVIAVLQGTVSAAGLTLAGIDGLFFFFCILLTLLSVIPLGAGILTIPIGVIMIATGNFWQGVLVIANHLLIVTNIDNVLRPQLVPKEAKLDPALMILAVFSGLSVFGFIGIVLGPVIMIVILTTIQMYLEVFKDTDSIHPDKSDKKPGLIKRIGQVFNKG